MVCLNQVGALNPKSSRMIETRWGPVPAPPRRSRSTANRAKPVRRDPGQLSLGEVATWGGRRVGAGRKAGPRSNVAHEARPLHRRRFPLLVTLRRAKGLPSLRTERLDEEIREAVRRTHRDDFRVVHYSVQADHVHMIVEAEDNASLSAGMKSFAVRVALRVNHVLRRRRGHVWADRYHRRDLRSPSQVRSTLVYVISNHLKHGEVDVGLIDPCSSARWFDGWMHAPDPPPEPSPTTSPQTWLLERGWHDGYRFLNLGEVPRALRV